MEFRNNFLYTTITVVLTFFLFYPILSVYIFSPNSHMYAFGGDALAIYYDIQYHVCHGSGTHFNGMNYPDGELIFLTDAQGALAMILQWVNKFVPICDYVIGIINFLNAISVLVASGIIYTILRSQGISNILSIIFSPLIIILSPQIFRLGGHFGLAYVFLIPMVYLYIIKSTEKLKVNSVDVLVFLILLFFTFNNPYLGFTGCALLMLSGALRWLYERSDLGKLKSFFVGIVPLMITFIYFKLSDPIDDRIKIQWGYFSFPSTPKGLIGAKGTLMSDILKSTGTEYNIDVESNNYIGMVSIIIIVLTLLFFIYKNFHSYQFSISKRFASICISSLILYLYSSGLFFLPFSHDFIEDKLGFLLMFKAIARIGWPIYFTIAILVVNVMDEFYSKTHKTISLPIIIILALIWNWDINTYVKPYFKDKINANFLGKEQEQKMVEIFQKQNINTNDFQCILSLPKIMTWTDNFISEVNWSAQYNSQNISRITKLPMLNAMLSRMSISQTAERIELLANPLVKKSIIDILPNKRDILIVLGTGYPELTSGEKFLLQISDTLYYKENEFSLHRLKVDDINNNEYIKAAQMLRCPIENDTHAGIYMGFNESKTEFSYFGKGAKKYEKGQHTILETKIENPESDHHIFSMWTRFDHLKYGIGWINCQVKDSTGNVIYNETPDTRRSNDVHDSWIRTEQRIPTPKNCTIKVIFDTNRILFVDELLIRPEHKDVIHCDDDKIMVNGYRLEK